MRGSFGKQRDMLFCVFDFWVCRHVRLICSYPNGLAERSEASYISSGVLDRSPHRARASPAQFSLFLNRLPLAERSPERIDKCNRRRYRTYVPNTYICMIGCALRLRRRQVQVACAAARTGGRTWRARDVFSNKRLEGPLFVLKCF